MLVPVQGGIENIQRRNRQIFMQQAGLASVDLPNVYIFNISRNSFPNRIGAGKTYTIPACPKGKAYSEPIAVPALILSEIDYADGGNNMGVVMNPAENSIVEMGDEDRKVIGVVNDIIGTDSTSPADGIFTTNLEWLGVFASRRATPTEGELAEAAAKLKHHMEMIYAQGAELVQQGQAIPMMDRPVYNEAAEFLGRNTLWGNTEYSKANCPECGENIIAGAKFCKHCRQAIDPTSVALRAKQIAAAAAQLAAEPEPAAVNEPVSAPVVSTVNEGNVGNVKTAQKSGQTGNK